jgi:hypothetical protein
MTAQHGIVEHVTGSLGTGMGVDVHEAWQHPPPVDDRLSPGYRIGADPTTGNPQRTFLPIRHQDSTHPIHHTYLPLPGPEPTDPPPTGVADAISAKPSR